MVKCVSLSVKVVKLKKLLILLLMTVASVAAHAQYAHGRTNNLINADNRLYHFGFILGLNWMDAGLTNAAIADPETGEIWFGEEVKTTPGFSIGIISDLRICRWLNLRFCPLLLFNERQFMYRDAQGKEAPCGILTVPSNMMEFPLTFKFRGQRKRNYRPYLLAGAAMTLDMGRDSEYTLMLKQIDYGVEFGVGCDFYLPYFKLAPEFKFYLGLGDVLERNRPDIADVSDMKYTNTISKLTSRLFTVSFNFE